MMEDFKDALEKSKNELFNSDVMSSGSAIDADLYPLREAIRYLIDCMKLVFAREEGAK